MANENDKILDRVITRQIDVLRLAEGQTKKTTETIAKSESELKTILALSLIEIDAKPTKTNHDKLATLERKITTLRNAAYAEAERETLSDTTELAEDDAEWLILLLAALLGVSVASLSNMRLTNTMIEKIVTLKLFAGRTTIQWFAHARTSDVSRIMLSVRSGVTSGLGVKEIIDSIFGTRLLKGSLHASENEVRAINRTVFTGVSDASQTMSAERSDEFDRVMWVSVLDGRTSQICRGLSGQIFPIEDHPSPPAHANCRSTLAYLLKGVPAPEIPSYDEWLRKQPDAFAKEVLPNWQYSEFKNGGKLDQFLANDLTPLTMREFRALKR